MKLKTALKIILALSSLGLLFAGYLSVKNLMQGNVCPVFIGIPACYSASVFYIAHIVLIIPLLRK